MGKHTGIQAEDAGELIIDGAWIVLINIWISMGCEIELGRKGTSRTSGMYGMLLGTNYGDDAT